VSKNNAGAFWRRSEEPLEEQAAFLRRNAAGGNPAEEATPRVSPVTHRCLKTRRGDVEPETSGNERKDVTRSS